MEGEFVDIELVWKLVMLEVFLGKIVEVLK